MSENDFLYQLNVSLPPSEQFAKGDMVNVRGRNAAEFMQNLTAFDQHMVEQAASLVSSIRAAWVVIRDAGGSTVEHDRPQAPPQTPQVAPQQPYGGQPGGYPQQQQAQPQGGYQQQPQQQGYQQPPAQPDNSGVPAQPPPHVGPPPQCSHGVKNFIAKPYKNGKPGYWMAWACPARRGDTTQHELEFISQK